MRLPALPWHRDGRTARLARRSRVLPVIALAAGLLGLLVPLHADAQRVIPSQVGSCVFSSLTSQPPLAATFSPDLSSIAGVGTCVVNAGYRESVTVDLAGGNLLNCEGGVESMSGSLDFGGVTGFQPVDVTAIGGPGVLELVLQGASASFVGSASLGYADAACPGSFTAQLDGTMTFET